jgi:putative transport protein
MTELHNFLVANPVGLLFLVIGIGYLIGKIRIASFDLGPVTGVLFAGLVFGHLGYTMSSTVQTLGFVLFIFSVGLQAGPRFFSVLRTDGLRYLALATVIGATGFVLAVALSKALGFDFGVAAGLLGGAMTTTPTLAAAQEALRSGQVAVPDGMSVDLVITNVTTAYAITYLFGLIGLILIIRLMPKLTGVDFKAEAAKLATEQRGGVEDAVTALSDIAVRAYRVTEAEFTGIPFGELYAKFPGLGAANKLRRDGEFIEITPETAAKIGDEIGVTGFLHHLLAVGPQIGPELEDAELLGDAIESCRVVVTRSKAKNLEFGPRELSDRYGCFLASVQRLGVDVPANKDTRFEAGDVLHVTGHQAALDRLGADLGSRSDSVSPWVSSSEALRSRSRESRLVSALREGCSLLVSRSATCVPSARPSVACRVPRAGSSWNSGCSPSWRALASRQARALSMRWPARVRAFSSPARLSRRFPFLWATCSAAGCSKSIPLCCSAASPGR